ncbi:MAG TPA: L,D-transpeptidase family protein [Chitinophagaceae bacterium]|nr:L,D-transpeptidase family protein [Chitinophagaceae bacterium]
MNKIFLISVTFCTILFACNNNRNRYDGKARAFKADTSITRANACNSLFLDSNALDNFIIKDTLNDTIANLLRAFYYDRNFEFAWFAPDGITEQGREFWNLYTYSVSSLKDSSFFLKALNKRMPDITEQESMNISQGDEHIIRTELMLTEAFMKYMTGNGKETDAGELMKYVPAKKEEVMQLANKILHGTDGTQNEDARRAFNLLKTKLNTYYNIAKNGGWQTIPYIRKKLKQGMHAPEVVAIKKRLLLTGELQGKDTSAVFDNLLDSAVKSFQLSTGYTPDGIVTDSLVSIMNIPAEKRVEQILINLTRMRWMPEYPSGRLIVTNIPEYELHVYENRQKAFNMDVVVGKQGAGTVVFTGNLTEIVFSPYWNIPPSIVKKEIVPKMDEDKNYLERENMEITGESNGLPIVRQLPGPKNALGRVKFLFHNSYNIYFHDTPAKELFNRDKRAYSHGCIRLADPVKMAEYLLNDNEKWTPDKITEAMNSGKEKYVTLKDAVPVIITYYTAWVDESGRLNFREDIYGHDASAAEKMFTNP